MKLLSTYAICACAVAVMAAASPAWAQAPVANPFTAIVRTSWDGIKKNVAASAAALPEADYGFKPVPTVRTFGQILGHLINEHYLMCSGVKGEKNPHEATDYEKTTSKAELTSALAASIAYCDAVYAAMTDSAAFGTLELFGEKYSKLGVLQLNATHDGEHYGNLVTYLRIKGIVPPSSAPAK
jgi:uncharacterized damage-inducible protein DinB